MSNCRSIIKSSYTGVHTELGGFLYTDHVRFEPYYPYIIQYTLTINTHYVSVETMIILTWSCGITSSSLMWCSISTREEPWPVIRVKWSQVYYIKVHNVVILTDTKHLIKQYVIQTKHICSRIIFKTLCYAASNLIVKGSFILFKRNTWEWYILNIRTEFYAKVHHIFRHICHTHTLDLP